MLCRLPFLVFLTLAAVPARAADAPIAPVLQNCVKCHNPAKASGKLDLTTSQTATKRKEPALIPGEPEKSLLFDRVSGREMPPDEPLSDKEIEIVRLWIKDGAKWPDGLQAPKDMQRAGADWWSLQPIHRPPIPQIRNPKSEI